MKVSVLFFVLLLQVLFAPFAQSQTPSTMSYQGYLENGGTPVDGTLPFTIRLFTQQSGGSAVWSQSYPSVVVTKGVYTILLDVSALSFDKPYWLETEIDGSVSSNRTALTSAPYALGPWAAGTPSMSELKSNKKSLQNILATKPIYYSNGNVGIGTTNPTQLLTVGGGSLADTKIEVNAGGDTYTGIHFVNSAGAWNWQLVPSNDLPGGRMRLTDETANNEWLSISHSGFVGIGAPDAKCKLDVRDSGGDIFHLTGYEPFITFYDYNHANARGAIQAVNGGLNLFSDSYLTGSNLYSYISLNNNGNFGVGTANPTAKLEVASLGGDIFHMVGYEPFLTFYDANHGYRRGAIQQVDGGLNLFTDSYLTGGNLLAYVSLNNSGNLGIGTATPTAKLEVAGNIKTKVLEITGGGDFSENFAINGMDARELQSGMIVSIDAEQPGKLIVSTTEYDHRVAGIISGAGGISPGMVMGQQGSIVNGKYPVALTGRVYCWADASTSPIEPGDILTTSSVPGHAMKAGDKEKANGAVIGKAMTGLAQGKGLVLVLVNLQ